MEYRKNVKNEKIWLDNFGIFGTISQQTNLFIKSETLRRYEKACSEVKEKYGFENLKFWKQSYLNEQNKGGFSDMKSIKVIKNTQKN